MPVVLYDMKPEELQNVPNTPATLEQALMALERDHDFLLRGGVFTESVIETWIDYKLTRMVSLFEPLLIVFMAVVVGGMLLALYLPLLRSYSQSSF